MTALAAVPADPVPEVPSRRSHRLKVQQPYFDDLLRGVKLFEVRRNDRAFQTGDRLILAEWLPRHVGPQPWTHDDCPVDVCEPCLHPGANGGHCPWTGRVLLSTVTYLFTGDPRFGALTHGFVVLGLSRPEPVGGAA